MEQGGLAAEDRLAQRRLGPRPADHLPAVDALQADLEPAPRVLVDERTGHDRDRSYAWNWGERSSGRDKRGEPPGDLGLPAVVVGLGVEQGVVGIDLDLRRLARGVHRHHPAIALPLNLGAGDFVASPVGPDRHAELALGAAAEHDRRLVICPFCSSSTVTWRTSASAFKAGPTRTCSTAQSVSLCFSTQPSRNAGQSALGVEGDQLALEVGVVEGLEGVVGVELAKEGEEPVVAEPVVDHLDDLAAAVVGQAEEGVEVAHRPQVLDDRPGSSLAPPAVVAGQPEVLAADRRQPAQPLGPSRSAGRCGRTSRRAAAR